jgi:hypothetical protein
MEIIIIITYIVILYFNIFKILLFTFFLDKISKLKKIVNKKRNENNVCGGGVGVRIELFNDKFHHFMFFLFFTKK